MNERIKISQRVLKKMIDLIRDLEEEIKENRRLSSKDVLLASKSLNELKKLFVPINNVDAEWLFSEQKSFYQKYFGIRHDFLSKITIPPRTEGYSRLLVVPKGMTTQRAFSFLREMYPCFFWSASSRSDDFDEMTENTRSAKENGYAIWLKDESEAEEELSSYPKTLMTSGVKGITLLEYLLFFTQCLDENDNNILDLSGGTLCSGTVFTKDPNINNSSLPPLWTIQVPLVYMNGNRLTIRGVEYDSVPEELCSKGFFGAPLDVVYRMRIRARSVIAIGS